MRVSPEAWKRLGLLFLDARHRSGLSRAKFADLAGVSEKAVFNAETGAPHRSVPPTYAKIAAAHGWTPESVQAVLNGGKPELADTHVITATDNSPAVAGQTATPPHDDASLTELLAAVNQFGRLCVAMGADAALRDTLDATAQRLVRSIPREALTRESVGLVAYRPHAPGEGPADDDAERIWQAMEEDT